MEQTEDGIVRLSGAIGGVSISVSNSGTIDTLNPEDGCTGSLILFTQTLSILGGGNSQKHDDNVHVGNFLSIGDNKNE